MSNEIQALMDDLAAKTHGVRRLQQLLESALAADEKAMAQIMARIEAIKSGHLGPINIAKELLQRSREALSAEALRAYRTGEFPDGKKRLNLDSGAWVTVASTTKYNVKDPMAAIEFLVKKEMPDAITDLKFTKGTEAAVFVAFKKFPGVERVVKNSVRVKLPKVKEEANAE